jgi:uncharacterized protein YndB with AHSA1/START domain
MGREFEIRREVDLEATPEQVWEAVATGPGNTAWLFPNEVGPVQVWDPPHHLAVRVEGDDGWFNALEFVIEGREGGGTVLRYVHSGIFTEDWDDQYDAAGQHTDFYLHTLGEYLKHFAGRPATYVGGGPDGITGPDASTAPGAFDAVREALGLANGAAPGDRVRLEPDGVDGVVDYLAPHFIGIRTADGLYRFFGRNAWGHPVGMSLHLFSESADAERAQRTWKSWLDGVFA